MWDRLDAFSFCIFDETLKYDFFGLSEQKIFHIRTEEEFNLHALEAFHYQLANNTIYSQFVHALRGNVSGIEHYSRIPFLPIEFFKTSRVYASEKEPELIFKSSGTTGTDPSIHAVADPGLYRSALLSGFRYFYGDPGDYLICALVPSPQENPRSSLAYMIDTLIKAGARPGNGFYLNDPEGLMSVLTQVKSEQRKVKRQPTIALLIGLTYALLDFAEQHPIQLPGAVIMETGGMKGRRKELIREELHSILKQAFGVNAIHSEYGMSELLSQAYSKGDGIFQSPPWMKVLIRDPYDPLSWIPNGKTGGISIIDLANRYSCPFIATQDLGKQHPDGSFEVLGRFDYSDMRGCNLMVT
ncbi:MAG: acyl transferase [bacterium]